MEIELDFSKKYFKFSTWVSFLEARYASEKKVP